MDMVMAFALRNVFGLERGPQFQSCRHAPQCVHCLKDAELWRLCLCSLGQSSLLMKGRRCRAGSDGYGADNRQISTIIAQYKAAGIDQRILGRFIDNQDLTRFQTLLDDNRLPPTRLRCAHSTLTPTVLLETNEFAPVKAPEHIESICSARQHRIEPLQCNHGRALDALSHAVLPFL